MNTAVQVTNRELAALEIRQIAAAHDNFVNPVDIVEAARDPTSILHSYFDWDDNSAAAKYRLLRAGHLVRELRITIIRPKTETREVTITTTREYQSLPSDRHSDGGYSRVETIMSSPEKREEMLRQALRELESIKRRYSELADLAEVWQAVDTALAASKPASAGAPAKPKAKK